MVELLLEGYDHILDAEDDGVSIIEITAQRKHEATVQFLQSIPNYIVSWHSISNKKYYYFVNYGLT